MIVLSYVNRIWLTLWRSTSPGRQTLVWSFSVTQWRACSQGQRAFASVTTACLSAVIINQFLPINVFFYSMCSYTRLLGLLGWKSQIDPFDLVCTPIQKIFIQSVLKSSQNKWTIQKLFDHWSLNKFEQSLIINIWSYGHVTGWIFIIYIFIYYYSVVIHTLGKILSCEMTLREYLTMIDWWKTVIIMLYLSVKTIELLPLLSQKRQNVQKVPDWLGDSRWLAVINALEKCGKDMIFFEPLQ